MNTYKIIDTPWDTSSQIACLKREGIETVIRYYNDGNSKKLPEKRLELAEAQALSAAGLNIMVVFQKTNNEVVDFTYDKGYSNSQIAYNWAKGTIGQPFHSAIYFAVDYDASKSDLDNNIIPYFQGIQDGFKALANRLNTYEVGVYGSGLVVNTLKNQGLCSFRWLSESSGFNGTQEALDHGSYELYQQFTTNTILCSLDVDFDIQNPHGQSMGAFKLKGTEHDDREV